jgi:hypothetical protein
MYEQLNAPENVVACRLSGLMTGEDIDEYQKLLHEKLDKHEHLGVCVDMTGLSDIDAEGFAKGTKADLDFLAHLGRFGRLAFVSDKRWPHTVIALYSMLMPGVEARVFTTAERERALAWAGEEPKHVPTLSGPALRTFATSEADVLGFEMNGKVGPDDLKPALDEFAAFLEKHETVRLLNRVRHFGFDPRVLLQGGLLSVKLAAMRKVEKYAVVGAPSWVEKAVAMMNPLVPDMEIRTFPAEKEAEAWQWIGAKPVA